MKHRKGRWEVGARLLRVVGLSAEAVVGADSDHRDRILTKSPYPFEEDSSSF